MTTYKPKTVLKRRATKPTLRIKSIAAMKIKESGHDWNNYFRRDEREERTPLEIFKPNRNEDTAIAVGIPNNIVISWDLSHLTSLGTVCRPAVSDKHFKLVVLSGLADTAMVGRSPGDLPYGCLHAWGWDW